MKRIPILLCALLLASAVLGQSKARTTLGPYLQAVTDDGFTVVWTTDRDAIAWVEVAPDDGTHFYAAPRTRYYDSHLGRLRVGRLHRVRVAGLRPGDTCRYRIVQQAAVRDKGKTLLLESSGTDVYRKSPYTATTLDPSKPQTRFWVVNDIHGRDSLMRLLLRDAAAERPDFVCLNGDMTSTMDSEQQLSDGYLATLTRLLTPAGIPFVFVRGNHETRGDFSEAFTDYFPSPTGQPYYTFRQGPVFFVVLDGGEDKPDQDMAYGGLADFDAYRRQQAEWLRGVVQSDEFRKAPYRIVLLHMVPASAESWHGEQQISRLFVPLLNGAGIDLMLSGHYHRYNFYETGVRGTDFPVLVNSNNDRIAVRADSDGIRAEVVNPAGKTIHEHWFAPRKVAR